MGSATNEVELDANNVCRGVVFGAFDKIAQRSSRRRESELGPDKT